MPCPICESSDVDMGTMQPYDICGNCGVEFGLSDEFCSHKELRQDWQWALKNDPQSCLPPWDWEPGHPIGEYAEYLRKRKKDNSK